MPNVAPAPAFASTSVATALERYLAITFERFERALVEASLADPRLREEVDRAHRQLDALVEALTGIAVGLAIGQVGIAIRRGFGAPARQAVEQQLARIARDPALVGPAHRPSSDDPPAASLVAALTGRLQPRLCGAVAIARAAIHELAATVARIAPHQVATLAMTLALLADDDASALAFADHLDLGWRSFAAIVSRGAAPSVPADPRWARCHETWRAWSRRVREGADEAPVLSHDEVVASGFVLRIA